MGTSVPRRVRAVAPLGSVAPHHAIRMACVTIADLDIEEIRAGAMTSLAFHGGTGLRFLFGLPRYSEELDFAFTAVRQGTGSV